MSSYITKKTPGETGWFTHDRFGMFIHFGLYAMPARHEWVKTKEEMKEEWYEQYFKHFNPDLFFPDEWARQAKNAGMKYVVITSKHHEGFCLFDSKYTDYKAPNTPIGRDLLREAIEAFRREGLRIGIYYSLIDWHHPDFTIDLLHPRRRDKDAREQNKVRDMKRYAQYMRNQLTELLTNYGEIDILWMDYSYEDEKRVIPGYCGERWHKGKGADDWEAEKLIETARAIQPEIIINNRTGIAQDIWTPEQFQPENWVKHPKTGEYVVWEACHTFSGSWGYNRDEISWKTPEMLIELLIRTVARGGNLLMNVGPTARGCFDSRAEKALKVYAEWMKYHSRSIYSCTMAEPEWTAPRGCELTQSADGKRLYIHLLNYPVGFLELPNMAARVEYIQFLHDGSELHWGPNRPVNTLILEPDAAENQPSIHEGSPLIIEVPGLRPQVIVPVIEIFLK